MADDEKSREKGLSKLQIFLRRLKIDISDPLQRVNWLKTVDLKLFLNLLAAGNKLLRGGKKGRWTDEERKMFVSMGGTNEYADFESPDNAKELFIELFLQMQDKLTVSNLDIWTIKLYWAIIFAHPFEDGNGRTARTVYSLMRGHPIEQGSIAGRKSYIGIACMAIDSQVHIELLKKEGIIAEGNLECMDYQAAPEDFFGITSMGRVLKFIAAKHVLENLGKYKGQKQIDYSAWPKNQKKELDKEYSKLLSERFWQVQKICEKYKNWLIEQLDKGLIAD